jgi:hypothetical protein
MRTEAEIQEMFDVLVKEQTQLVENLDTYAKLSTTCITNEEREKRLSAVKAINRTLNHVRVQIHSFRWVLAG